MKAAFESEAWASKFKFKRRANVRGPTPVRYPGIVEINENAKLTMKKKN